MSDRGPVGHRVSCPHVVGRAPDLDLLTSTFDAVADGQAAAVLIGGEAGVGKTRLLDEFCERARAAGALVATGVCVPMEGGGLPYGPVVGVLRDLGRQLGDRGASEVLGPLAIGLGLDMPAPDGRAEAYSAVRPLADELAKTRLFESILGYVTTLASRSPTVLVFEDLQWADSASTELLSFLIRNLTDARVLLIGTFRSEEVGRDHQLRPWLGELGRHARVAHIDLTGLERDDVVEMIGGILGHEPDWALVDAVCARSQGNPFFIEELTAARGSSSLSPELGGVIMARVETLSDDVQQVLRVVATTGTSVDHRLLLAAGGIDAEGLDDALAAAVDAQILVVDPDHVGYQFRHALLREAVYATLLPGERARLHRMMATALAADASLSPTGPGRYAAELAAHWWSAGEWAESYLPSIAAADDALALWAFPEALVHLERALSAMDRSGAATPAGDRLELLERASDTAYLASANERSIELARRAVEEVDVDVEPARAARLYTLLGRNTWTIGDSQAAFDAYRHAAAVLPADPPSVALARVLAEEGRGLMMMSRYRDAEARCHEAIAIAQAVGARSEEGHALNTLGCCREALGHIDEGIELVREALQIAEQAASPEDLNRAFGNLSGLLLDSGQLEAAAALVHDNAAVGEDLWGVRLESATSNSSEALILLGRYDEAEELLIQVGSKGLGACAASPAMARLAIVIRRGRFDEAEQQLAGLDVLTAGLSDVQQRGGFFMLAAELALEQARPVDAFTQVEQALALAAGTDDETYTPEMCGLAVRALADRLDDARIGGRHFDADKARLLARGFVEEGDRLVAAPTARGGRCLPRSEAFAAMYSAEESRLHASDPDLWQAAAARWDALSVPHSAAYCRYREAESLLDRREERSRADECLQQAWRASVDMGVLPLRERIESLARRGRIALVDVGGAGASDGPSIGDDLGLTPREVEVLGQLAAGRRDGEIAESLFISKKTASVHVSNILRKLDVANRIEAGKIGQAHGLG